MSKCTVCDAVRIYKKYGFPHEVAVIKAMNIIAEIEEYTIVKRGNKWCVVHGHAQKPESKTDKPKGATIACHDTREQALQQLQAIKANQSSKHDSYAEDGRPPKDWWDACVSKVSSGNPGYSEEQVRATCGSLWHKKGIHEKLS